MLANARVAGHVFDPLSVFWCFDSGGDLACVVAEVHNTYGERHAYLLRPDHTGTARTGKELYVSPFNDVERVLHAALRPLPRAGVHHRHADPRRRRGLQRHVPWHAATGHHRRGGRASWCANR